MRSDPTLGGEDLHGGKGRLGDWGLFPASKRRSGWRSTQGKGGDI
jgi:hypothetical protein